MFTHIARASRVLIPAKLRAAVATHSGRSERGQILPMVAGGMMAFVMFATLLIDGSMMMQARRDLEIIAEHAASSGAQQVDFNSFRANCARGRSADYCADRIRVQVNPAINRSRAVARQWIDRNNAQSLTIPSFAPSSGGGDVITNRTTANQVVVTIRRCYRPFLINIFTRNNGDGCTNATLIEVTARARPLGGN